MNPVLIRRLHMPSLGVLALLIGGILRVIAAVFHWPIGLVLVSQLTLLLAVLWILFYDIFPLFLNPFYLIRKRFPRRHSFFVLLFLLFGLMQLVTVFLPSGRTKDFTTTLSFLSFMGGVAWFVCVTILGAFTPLIRHWKYQPRESEKVTFEDIVTSMALIVTPTVALSFFFSPPGLGTTEVTPYQIFVTSLLTNIFMGIYLYLWIIRPRVFTLKQLGLKKVPRERVGEAFVLFVFIVVLIAILQAVLKRLGLPLQNYSFSTKEGAAWAMIMVAVVSPFVEELYFRGFLFKGLMLNHRPQIAYLVSAGLFALLHPPLAAMVEVFAIGILLGYLSKETKSIWPGIFIHALNNAIVFGYLLYK
ncbi:MAG TPA: type II CAAX endopeptidase family protein [Patescibacteria group bacterium]